MPSRVSPAAAKKGPQSAEWRPRVKKAKNNYNILFYNNNKKIINDNTVQV